VLFREGLAIMRAAVIACCAAGRFSEIAGSLGKDDGQAEVWRCWSVPERCCYGCDCGNLDGSCPALLAARDILPARLAAGILCGTFARAEVALWEAPRPLREALWSLVGEGS